MVGWLARSTRELFRRERIPARLRWWFVADGMVQWLGLLRADLAPHVRGDAAAVVARLHAPVLVAGYDRLRAAHPSMPDRVTAPRAVGLAMGALYRVASAPAARWIFEPVGGAPASLSEFARAERWLASIPVDARWRELTNHLGELLIALTIGLGGDGVPRAHAVLGDICFAAGVRVGRKMKKAFELPATPDAALEVLRMSEYVFRVNPEHWGASDVHAKTGYLEGTACPWFTAPGWNGAHCGIFGQFQSGIASVFGLRYHLTTTIPKHGGHTCRIDVKPIQIRVRPATQGRVRAAGGPA